MKRNSFILVLIIVIIGVIAWNFLSQPGIKDLKGDFKEVAFMRNEQNEGPVIRLYAVTVTDEYWNEMQQYGNYMPHTKYGTTKVYFFRANGASPKTLNLEEPYISTEFQSNCLAVYEKDGMSQVKFKQYPFRK